MNCCSRNREPTKEVVLNFYREELLYDISNYCFIEGDLLETEDAHTPHQVQDATEEGNIDRITRVLNLAHASCVEMLYPYTKEEIDEKEELDNKLPYHESFPINLRLPEGFSMTTISLIKKLIHEYLVCYAVSDWMSITKRESYETWKIKLDDVTQRIRSALTNRRGRIRIRQHPF